MQAESCLYIVEECVGRIHPNAKLEYRGAFTSQTVARRERDRFVRERKGSQFTVTQFFRVQGSEERWKGLD